MKIYERLMLKFFKLKMVFRAKIQQSSGRGFSDVQAIVMHSISNLLRSIFLH